MIRIAPFCKIEGRVYKAGQIDSVLWKCRAHGNVLLVDWVNGNNYTQQVCVECLKDYFKLDDIPDVEIDTMGEIKTCSRCGVKAADVVDCELCGKSFCDNHMMEAICDGCNADIENMCGGSYRGICG